MNKFSLLAAGLALALHASRDAGAQTLDPGFAANSVYAPGYVFSMLEQPDGKRVVAGAFNRVNGVPAWGISRLDASGNLDLAFQQNIGTGVSGYRLRLASNGQLYVVYPGNTVTVGGVTRKSVVRLNADGTGDAAFDSGTGPTYQGAETWVDDLLPLANGQSIAVGLFDHYNGVSVGNIVRLTAAGTVDATFHAGLGANDGDDIDRIVALPNGQFLACGYITGYNGTARAGVIRLNADGSLDPTFVTTLSTVSEVTHLVVQPDGRILIAGSLYTVGSNPGQAIMRLLADGGVDPSFTPPAALGPYDVYSRAGEPLQLQPDGKILIASVAPAAGLPGVTRLNSDGTLDASFQPGIGQNAPGSLALLTSGQVLVGGDFTNFSGTLDRPLVQLSATGTLNPSFLPLIQTTGLVSAVVRQADGKFVAGGNFSEINGQPVRRLARFNADGTRDASFVNPAGDFAVVDLAQQPDGRLLVAMPSSVIRLQAGGSPDNSFTTNLKGSRLTRLLLQPDGRVLVGGQKLFINGTSSVSQGLLRLLPDGSRDASFAPNGTGPNRLTSFINAALQPDGKILVAARYIPTGSNTNISTVVRLEANGAVDAGFATAPIASADWSFNALAVQPDGKVLLGGNFSTVGGTPRSNLARLNADGTLDAGFTPPALTGTVNTLLLQPNNRVLVGGSFTAPGLPANLARLLPDGTHDASFAATAVPNGTVRSLLVQPDGALLMAGSFTQVSNTPIHALARITAPNVLSVAAPAAVAERTAAWPVPAHTALHVAPDPGAHAQTLELFDLTGHSVRRLALSGRAEAVLPVLGLPAGIYLLRVTYAEGTVARRVQVQ